MKNLKIELDEPWRSFVLTLAGIVYDNKKNLGVIDFDSNPKKVKINGFGAEVAVAIYLNRCPDGRILRHGNNYDLIYKGNRIDVKTTEYENGKLITPQHKKPEDVDIFVFTIGSFPTYIIIGWLEAKELFKKERIETLAKGKTPCYVARQHELKSMHELTGEEIPTVLNNDDDIPSWED